VLIATRGPVDEDSKHLCIVCHFLREYTAHHPRWQSSSCMQPSTIWALWTTHITSVERQCSGHWFNTCCGTDAAVTVRSCKCVWLCNWRGSEEAGGQHLNKRPPCARRGTAPQTRSRRLRPLIFCNLSSYSFAIWNVGTNNYIVGLLGNPSADNSSVGQEICFYPWSRKFITVFFRKPFTRLCPRPVKLNS
jgi:hypothetical protein